MKHITCILPRGEGSKLSQLLAQNKGISSTTIGSGRGFSERNDVIREVDMVEIIVPANDADEIFDYIHQEFEFANQKGRFMYMHSLIASSLHILITPEDLHTYT